MKLFISFKIFFKKCSQWASSGSVVAHRLYFATHSQRWPTSVLLSGIKPFSLVLSVTVKISFLFCYSPFA